VAEHHVTYRLSEDQELIRSTAREFLGDRLGLGRVRELMMTDDGFERPLWKEMADMGWPGLAIAEEHGGAGLGPVELAVLLEEMGRLVTPGPFFASAVLATNTIQVIGDDGQLATLLPRLASGETIATLAVFEGPRGWRWDQPSTRAERVGEGWTVSGTKRGVLDAHLADQVLVTARDGDELGVFLVATGDHGVTITQEPAFDPTRRQCRVELDAAPAVRLGAGDARQGMERVLRLAAVALAAEQVGGAQAAMEMAVEYAKTRYQFGRPIGSYQAIKHRCANMLMRVEQARSAAYYASRVTEDDEELAVASPLAASVASPAYVWVAGENIQVHGGIGFTWEHDAHIYLKRAKTSSLMLGSAHHQRDLLGTALGI
jgi:alkylation response protein AidB-like acyl-CoA dehydrogenase